MKNLRNLRNRPFLVVDIVWRPAKHSRTERKGWGDETSAWDIDEQPRLVNRVTNNTMLSATVIIDLVNKAAIKNGFAVKGTSDEDVVEHFLKVYAPYIQANVGLLDIG